MDFGVFLRLLVGGCIMAWLMIGGTIGLVTLQRRQASKWWLRLGFAGLLGLIMGTIALIADPVNLPHFAVLGGLGVVGGFVYAIYLYGW